MRDNLHNYIALSSHFPGNLAEAVKEGCEQAEAIFQRRNQQTVRDKSGSCALILLIQDQKCTLANVGDSRAVMSASQQISQISRDHKPCDADERRRIE